MNSEKQLIIHDIREKIYWAIRMRYVIVVLGLILLPFAFFSNVQLGPLPYLLGFVLAYNLAAHLICLTKRRFEWVWQTLFLQSLFLIFDILTVTFFIYISGGLESPYWFFYLVLIIISGFGVYSYTSFSVFLIAVFSAAFYLGLLVLTYYGIIPTYGPTFSLSPQELLRSIINKAVFTTISFFLFAATIYYFSKLIVQHRYELAKKNQELLGTLEELKEIDRLKDDFVTTASHELRTPLSVVRENVSLIEDGVIGQTSDKQKELLKVSRLNIDRLAGILDSLLDISKIESRSLELKREKVNFSLLAARAVEILSSRAAEKKIVLKLDVPDRLETLADPDQILRVFINLIDNAIKYTPEGGRVEIGLFSEGSRIKGCVTDNGLGIVQADLKKIFERFVRLESEQTALIKGTGLGLSICLGILEMHGGSIWAESKGAGQGSTFIFTVPKVEA
ncbi:MAG: HAMP domain-containing histidine kinase [Candidatus Saganbacteria bacterium]|nr:HAMP domain-containing histidine kinase [Candidatus Saganbacteria bacterium]